MPLLPGISRKEYNSRIISSVHSEKEKPCEVKDPFPHRFYMTPFLTSFPIAVLEKLLPLVLCSWNERENSLM